MNGPREPDGDAIADARRRAYAEFMAPGPLPPGADPEAAEAQLLAALERELGVRLGDGPAPAPRPAPVRTNPFAFLWAPAARPAFALAVLVVAATLGWTLFGPAGREPSSQLRGAADSAGIAAPAAPRLSVVPLDAGRVRLAWTAVPGATRYAVVFLGADLAEIARVDDLATTGLVLDPAALPAGLARGRSVLCRVTAFADRDEIARSTTSPVTLP